VYATDSKGKSSRRTIRGTNRSMNVVSPGYTDEVSNLYRAAAYLAIQMIGVDRSTHFGRSQATVVTKAIWGLVSRHSGTPAHSNGPTYYAQFRSPHRIPNINIWKPKPKEPRDPNVRVPEPSIVSLLAFNALVLAAFGYFLRRRGVGLAS
jgi:hypothetical protein